MGEEGGLDTVAVLAGLRIFHGVEREVLERVARRTVVRTLPERRLLFREGDPCDGLHVVLEGRVRVYRASPDGREQILHEQGPGQSLAEVPLFDGGSCPAHARAEVRTRLLFLPRGDFETLYRTEPTVADAVIRELGRRLRGAVRLIERISLRDVPSRVGLTLLDLARARAREGHDPTAPFTLSRTQTELAESLATTRESVARALRSLREEGLIEQEGGRVRIPDLEALEARSRGV